MAIERRLFHFYMNYELHFAISAVLLPSKIDYLPRRRPSAGVQVINLGKEAT
jgi:hypothetical protein